MFQPDKMSDLPCFNRVPFLKYDRIRVGKHLLFSFVIITLCFIFDVCLFCTFLGDLCLCIINSAVSFIYFYFNLFSIFL